MENYPFDNIIDLLFLPEEEKGEVALVIAELKESSRDNNININNINNKYINISAENTAGYIPAEFSAINNSNNFSAVPYCTDNRIENIAENIPAENTTVTDGTVKEKFNKLWEIYPNKRYREDAYKAFCETDIPFEELLSAVEVHKHSVQWTKDPNGQYIPSLRNYIEKGLWKEKLELAKGYAPPPTPKEVAEVRQAYEKMKNLYKRLTGKEWNAEEAYADYERRKENSQCVTQPQ